MGARLARSLQLGAIAALTLALIAFAQRGSLAATVLFTVAAVRFLIVLILQRRLTDHAFDFDYLSIGEKRSKASKPKLRRPVL